jgi:hypothetical protein
LEGVYCEFGAPAVAYRQLDLVEDVGEGSFTVAVGIEGGDLVKYLTNGNGSDGIEARWLRDGDKTGSGKELTRSLRMA